MMFADTFWVRKPLVTLYETLRKSGKNPTVTIFSNPAHNSKIKPLQLVETVRKYGRLLLQPVDYSKQNLTPGCDSVCDQGSKPVWTVQVTGLCNNSWPFVHLSDKAVAATDPNPSISSLPCFLTRKFSAIKLAGRGIFTEIDIPAGIVFGPYKGVRIYSQEEAKRSGYAWLVPRMNNSAPGFFYIDAKDPTKANWLRYVNSARFREEQNIFAFDFEEEIFYLVTKFIPAGSELFTWYGGQYLDQLHLNLTDDAPKLPGLAPPKKFVICNQCETKTAA